MTEAVLPQWEQVRLLVARKRSQPGQYPTPNDRRPCFGSPVDAGTAVIDRRIAFSQPSRTVVSPQS